MPAHVLVVDDTPLNVKLLTIKLEHEDYVVNAAADGFDALAKIEAEKPDIVLLDEMMPGLDGFETCPRIRADPTTAHIPIVDPAPIKPAIAAVHEKCPGELDTLYVFVLLTRQGDLPAGRLAVALDGLGPDIGKRERLLVGQVGPDGRP